MLLGTQHVPAAYFNLVETYLSSGSSSGSGIWYMPANIRPYGCECRDAKALIPFPSSSGKSGLHGGVTGLTSMVAQAPQRCTKSSSAAVVSAGVDKLWHKLSTAVYI
jgi:hypothetical protein